MPNFFNKEKYVLSYENLQLYLRLRLSLKKIHFVLEVNQSQWLKPYIEFNIQERIEAEKNNNKDGRALYKLMNNPMYGKNGKFENWKSSKQWEKLFKIHTKLNYMLHEYLRII